MGAIKLIKKAANKVGDAGKLAPRATRAAEAAQDAARADGVGLAGKLAADGGSPATPKGRVLSKEALKRMDQKGISPHNVDEIIDGKVIIRKGDETGSFVYSKDVSAMRSYVDPGLKGQGAKSIQVTYNPTDNVVVTVFWDSRPTRWIPGP